jgi:hypothetical protein
LLFRIGHGGEEIFADSRDTAVSKITSIRFQKVGKAATKKINRSIMRGEPRLIRGKEEKKNVEEIGVSFQEDAENRSKEREIRGEMPVRKLASLL